MKIKQIKKIQPVQGFFMGKKHDPNSADFEELFFQNARFFMISSSNVAKNREGFLLYPSTFIPGM
jgi:hypothetical protein